MLRTTASLVDIEIQLLQSAIIDRRHIVSPRSSCLFKSTFCSHFACFPWNRCHVLFSEVVFLASNTLTHIYQLMTYISDRRVEEVRGGSIIHSRSLSPRLPPSALMLALLFTQRWPPLLSRRPWIGHRLLVPRFAALFFLPVRVPWKGGFRRRCWPWAVDALSVFFPLYMHVICTVHLSRLDVHHPHHGVERWL